MVEMHHRCGPPYWKQMKFMNLAGRDERGISITHFVGGRGSGKTETQILFLFDQVKQNPGCEYQWTSPRYKEGIKKTFLPKWKRIVPEDAYTINKADGIITMYNGAVIYLDSRKADQYDADVGRGATVAGVVFDEPREDKNRQAFDSLIATVRCPRAKQLWVTTSSTPLMGWYHDLVVKGGDPVVYAKSSDNPYLPDGFVDKLFSLYDGNYAKQEVLAEWISLSGLIWDNAVLTENTFYPYSHWHKHTFNPGAGFTLMCDLGVRSAWLLTQRVPSSVVGWPPVDVAVAEFTPNDGDTDKMCIEIEQLYGIPSRVIVGSDSGTRDINTSMTANTTFSNHGWNCRVTNVTHPYDNKHMQYINAKRTLADNQGHIRFAISHKLQSHYSNGRGIVDVLQKDAWSKKAIHDGEFLPKDKRGSGPGLEDMRDAWLYGMTVKHPPSVIRQDTAGRIMIQDVAA